MIKFKHLLVITLSSFLSTLTHAGLISSPTIESSGEFSRINSSLNKPGTGYYSVFGNIDADGKGTSVIDLYAGCSLPSNDISDRNNESCDMRVDATSTITYQFMVGFDDPLAAQEKLGSQFFSMFFDWSFGYQVDLDLRNTSDRRWSSNGSVSVELENDRFGRRVAQNVNCDPLKGGCNSETSVIGDSFSGTRTFTDFGTLGSDFFDVQDDNLVTITMRHNASLFVEANNFLRTDGIFSIPAMTSQARITSFLDPIIRVEDSISDLVSISDFTVTSRFTEDGENSNDFGGVQGVQSFELFNLPTRPSTNVSEPHTIAILAMGLAGLFYRRRGN